MRVLTAGLTALALATAVTQATASGPPPHARLTGTFQLAGVVYTAVNVRGEHKNEKVLRTWTFTPVCSVGQCGRVKLVRARSSGTDKLTLRWRSPNYYTGKGSFYQALRCGSHLWHRGALVPFKITVRITAAGVRNGVLVATRVRAFYINSKRINKTPCVAVLGHDAAKYHGHLVQTGPSQDGPSGRSPAGN